MAFMQNSLYTRRQSRRKADVNITNLMDVMMVLLVVTGYRFNGYAERSRL